MRMDLRVKGWPSLVGRVVAVWMTKCSSSGLSRRGRPPAHRGSNAGQTGLVEAVDDVADGVLVGLYRLRDHRAPVPAGRGRGIIARRYRTELVLPRRTICCSFCPSWAVNLRA